MLSTFSVSILKFSQRKKGTKKYGATQMLKGHVNPRCETKEEGLKILRKDERRKKIIGYLRDK